MKKSIFALASLSIIGILALILVPSLSLRENREFTPVTISSGDYSLRGYLSKGSDPQAPYILYFHTNRPQGQAHPLSQHILQMFPERMTVLGVDALGYGESKVEPTADPIRILDHEPDWRAAMSYLEETLGARKSQMVLIGHSMGSTIVMDAARKDSFLLSIPIGLGDWKVVLDSPEKTREHIKKIKQYTGVSVDPELLGQHKTQYMPEVVFGSCPQSPVRLVFARFDDGRETLFPYITKARDQCENLVDLRVLPLGDHMYGTEITRFPEPVRALYSRVALTLLKWQLLRLIQQAES